MPPCLASSMSPSSVADWPASMPSTACASSASGCGLTRRVRVSAAPGSGTAIPARAATSRVSSIPTASPKWPERYGTQPEILKYINHVADRFDLRRDVQLDTRIKTAMFDGATNEWTLRTESGEEIRARYCIMAAGNLSTPRVPDFKGIGSFKGKWYHSGLWPHEGVDFTGLRVGVIGTGSSGVQMIPLIARQAKHLHVFQRTANFSLPARNAPMEEERESRHKADYPARRRAAYDTPFAIGGYPRPTKSALEATEEERNAAYESKWQEGGSISYLYTYTDLLVNKEANDTASEFARNKIRGIVKDKATAELLAPTDTPIGTKRLCLDTN